MKKDMLQTLKNIDKVLMKITKEIRRQDAVMSANLIILRFIMT